MGYDLNLIFQVDSDDALPKTICLKCVNKVDEYHKFREECVLAGLSLQSSLKESQPQAFPLEPEVCIYFKYIFISCKLN